MLSSTARIPTTLKPAKRMPKPSVTPIASRGHSVRRVQNGERAVGTRCPDPVWRRSLAFTVEMSRESPAARIREAPALAAAQRGAARAAHDGR